MKVLGIQIANGFSPEARVFAGLLRHRGDAYDARVIHHDFPDDPNDAARRFEEHSGVSLERLDFGWRSSVQRRRSILKRASSRLTFRRVLPRALEIAREYDPDVVYSCQQKWDCRAAAYIARKLGKPQVIHLHYTVGPWLGRETIQSLRSCDQVITVSDFIRDDVLRSGVRSGGITTLLNSIPPSPDLPGATAREVRDEFGVPAGAPLAGIVARLAEDKGQADTIDAFSRLDPASGAHLLVVGDGPARPAFEEQVAGLGLTDRVIFTGRRADVARILSALDVFVHPSLSDPCPLAVLEALAAGLPVVAYADGGIPELVQDGVTGLLAPKGDRASLAQALGALLEDAGRATQMGRAARDRIAAEFRPEARGGTFAEILAEVVSGEAQPAQLVTSG